MEPDQKPSADMALNFFHGESRTKIEQAYQNAIEHGTPYDVAVEIVSAKGVSKWVRSICDPVLNDGHVAFLQGSFQDITEFKRTEESLRLVQFLFEKAPIGIWQMGEEGSVLDVNEQGCVSLGYTREELCNLKVFDFDPEFEVNEWSQYLAKLNISGYTTFESKHKCKNGVIFPVRVMANILQFNGNPIHVAFVEDIRERKRIEESLHLARSIIDSANVAIYQISAEGRINSVNPKAAELLGYTQAELENLTLYDIDVELDSKRDAYTWQKLRFRRHRNLERQYRRKDSWVIDVAINSTLMEFEGQEYAVAFVHDISRRKKDEEALREKDQLLHDIGRLVKIGAWKYDLETGAVASTDEVARIYDLDKPQDLSIEEGLVCFHGVYREQIEQAFNAAIENGTSYELELEIISTKGVPKWVRTSGYPVIKDGRVVRLQGAIQDITRTKQAELQLKESENRYRSLIQHSPVGIGVINSEYLLVDVNQAYASILGYEIAELLNQNLNLEDLSHPDDFQCEKNIFESLALTNKTSSSIEKRHKHKDGHYVWTHVTVGKALDIYGPGVYYFGFMSDITKRRQLEDDRSKLIDDLQKALKEIKELKGFFPICSKCKKIRDDEGYWQQVEKYIMERTGAQFSHSYCPECYEQELEKIDKL